VNDWDYSPEEIRALRKFAKRMFPETVRLVGSAPRLERLNGIQTLWAITALEITCAQENQKNRAEALERTVQFGKVPK
jgi:hypothetical protein